MVITRRYSQRSDALFWGNFGFVLIPANDAFVADDWFSSYNPVAAIEWFDNHPDTAINAIVPAGVIAVTSGDGLAGDKQRYALQAIGIIPSISGSYANGGRFDLYGFDGTLAADDLRKLLNETISVLEVGQVVQLPSKSDFDGVKPPVSTIEELTVLDSLVQYGGLETGTQLQPTLTVSNKITPLDKFSLIGQGAQLMQSAEPVRGFLGNAILQGQATVVYAPPNAGKTLLTLHLLSEARLNDDADNNTVFYVNADDSGLGVAEKVEILDELGVHTLVPGMNGFSTGNLLQAIHTMVLENTCKDVVIVVDTLKKFVDLMDKHKAASFGDLIRNFIMKGGTFVALAHTRKNGSPDGDLVYGGTSDIMEDFDAACYLTPLEERTPKNEKIVQFQFTKRRGPNEDEAYAYDDSRELTYQQRLASVRSIDAEDMDKYGEAESKRADSDIIAAISLCLAEKTQQKMALLRAAAEECGASRRAVLDVLDRYTGDDPTNHRWTYSVEARGAKVFRLIEPEPEPDTA